MLTLHAPPIVSMIGALPIDTASTNLGRTCRLQAEPISFDSFYFVIYIPAFLFLSATVRPYCGRTRILARTSPWQPRHARCQHHAQPSTQQMDAVKWHGSAVAPERTHHVAADGAPMYSARFDEVLPFHEPGLAPVYKGEQAWHINEHGLSVYQRRFTRTFGFYGGRAAVEAVGKAWHIGADGTDLYNDRYSWCGNYQDGRCVVRSIEGWYLHLDEAGKCITASSGWRYAGDFRDGVAVVYDDDGYATHVDSFGGFIHGVKFLDLDVFHKGFARARDEHGWMHVDSSGTPQYPQRFREVEPFYNGQARVHRFDGGVEVIDEVGRTILEVQSGSVNGGDTFESLSADLVGFWRTQALCTAVECGVFDVLPGRLTNLAASTSIPKTQLHRLLRALGELEAVQCDFENIWSATEKGKLLCVKHPQTLADAALEYGNQMTAAWRKLPQFLREPHGNSSDVFREVAADPVRLKRHHRMLRSYAAHDYADVPSILQLGENEVVLDVGGGTGVLTSAILSDYANVQVVLVDIPAIVAEHKVPPHMTDRLTVCGIDFQGDWSEIEHQVDAAVLARVLHDFDDDQALQLLQHVRNIVKPGGRIFVIEFLLPEKSFSGGLCDLHLLAVTGGRERSLPQLQELLQTAGFMSLDVRHLETLPSVLIAS